MGIPSFVKQDGEKVIFNQDGELLYYVPYEFFKSEYAYVTGQYVSLIGLFNYTVVDKNGKNNGLKKFILPSRFVCRPNKMERLKEVRLIAESEPEDYMVLHFIKGDELITSTKLAKDIENVEDVYRIFLSGKFPTTFNHNEIQNIFTINGNMNGLSYKLNMQMFGLVISEMTRSKKDKSIPYRLSKSTNPKDYCYVSVVDVPKYISPFQAITSQNWDESIVGSIINDNPKASPMEKLLTEANSEI